MKIDKKLLDSCPKCGFVFDIEILGMKETGTKIDGLTEFFNYEGFIPWKCPNCGEFNNYREQ